MFQSNFQYIIFFFSNNTEYKVLSWIWYRNKQGKSELWRIAAAPMTMTREKKYDWFTTGERVGFPGWTPLQEQTGRDLRKRDKKRGPQKNSSLLYLYTLLYICIYLYISILFMFYLLSFWSIYALHFYIFLHFSLSLFHRLIHLHKILFIHTLSSLLLSNVWFHNCHLITLKSELFLQHTNGANLVKPISSTGLHSRIGSSNLYHHHWRKIELRREHHWASNLKRKLNCHTNIFRILTLLLMIC